MLAVATAGQFFADDAPLVQGALASLTFGIAAMGSIVVWLGVHRRFGADTAL